MAHNKADFEGDFRSLIQRLGGAVKRLRFRLRSLVILVLLVGGALGWFVHRARVQRNAVAAVKSIGGQAVYDFEDPRGA